MRTSKSRFVVACLLIGSVSACDPTLQGFRDTSRLSLVHRVVILPFAVPEGAPRSLSESFVDEISSNLEGRQFTLVDRLNADAMVIGRVMTYQDQGTTPDVDTSLGVAVRIVDTRTGEVMLSTSANATAAATFCSQDMQCLRGKVMGAIGRFIVGRT
jgi:Lipopolysaccharide-assembly